MDDITICNLTHYQSYIITTSLALGSLNGALSTVAAHDLGKLVIKAALDKAQINPGDVSEVILGQVLTAGQGQNPARQASINSGIPHTVPACTVNMVCGSGMRSVVLGSQAIQLGDSKIVVAGGQESMSQVSRISSTLFEDQTFNVELLTIMLDNNVQYWLFVQSVTSDLLQHKFGNYFL